LSWREEDRFLLYCCRAEDERAKNKLIGEERKDIDWNYFLKKARENAVSAIVYFRLNKNKSDFPDIPQEILEELKSNYYLNATKNTLLFEELGRALEAFKKSGLPVIALKGAALAETAYGNLALRPMTDIDLLVKKEDMFRIDEELRRLGYWSSDRSVNDVDFLATYLMTLDYRTTSPNSPSFHIHWHFVNSTVPNEIYIRHIQMEDIWKDAEKAIISNVETLVMAPHHLLIHLSEHALRVTHSLGKLSFLCDISEAINFYQERLNWERLLESSFKFHLNPMVYFTLYFTSQFLEARIPEHVLQELRPKRLTLGERIFMNSVSNNNHVRGLSYLVHLPMNEGFFRKTKFVFRTFFPPREILAQRNYLTPSKFSVRYYFFRINEIFAHLLKIVK
jgi:hypothetical protein